MGIDYIISDNRTVVTPANMFTNVLNPKSSEPMDNI